MKSLRPLARRATVAAALALLPLAACGPAAEKPAAQPTSPPPAGSTPAPAAEGAAPAAGGEPTLLGQIQAKKRSILDGVSDAHARKTIMKDIARQLGATCDDCHDVSDFSAPSVNKTIADYMFTHFAVALVDKSGAPITCEHCHGGATKFLDRSNKDKLRAYMQAEYVDKLQLAGGGAVQCETCHVKGKDQPFLPRTATGG